MTLLDVLSPEHLTLEQFCAVRHFAAILRFILLLDILRQLVFKPIFDRLATNLAKVDTLRVKDLDKLVLIRLNPIVCLLELLIYL